MTTAHDDDPTWLDTWSRLFTRDDPRGAAAADRSRAIVRRGRVEEVRLVPGLVEGRVRTRKGAIVVARLAWPVAEAEAWSRAVDALAGAVRHTAALMDGRLDDVIVAALQGSGVRLAPGPEDLAVSCTCGHVDGVCAHVLATHALLLTRWRRSPESVLELRGRSRASLLRAVRARRRTAAGDAFDAVGGIDTTYPLDRARGSIDAVVVRPDLSTDPGRVVRLLGAPPGTDDTAAFERLVDGAARLAWRLAAGDGADAADEQALLASLRGRASATAGELAEALGRPSGEVRAQLDRLYAAGAVLRSSAGADARYRAAATGRGV